MSSTPGALPCTGPTAHLVTQMTARYVPYLFLAPTLANNSADVILFPLAQYITWVNDNKTSWTVNAGGTAADEG